MKKFEHIDLLNEMVEKGYINVQTHPTLPLKVYKYSLSAQFEKVWNGATSKCRGLVLDNDFNVIGNCIEKFFNIEELPLLGIELPNLPFQVFDKVDGSCIEVFLYKGQLVVCTLGSFESDQAKIATRLLYDIYSDQLKNFIEGYTYIFELVVPENRIVLNYGQDEKLVHIVTRSNDDDSECFFFPGFENVQRFDMTLDKLMEEKKRPDFVNKEGFVLRFSNGFRVKVKYEEYFRLHKIMTGVNEKFVWEFLKEGKPIPLDGVPDEFFQYVEGVKNDLLQQYMKIDMMATEVYSNIYVFNQSRKDFAMKAIQSKYKSILFKMLEGKPYDQIIWDMIEPKFCKTQFSSLRKSGDDE